MEIKPGGHQFPAYSEREEEIYLLLKAPDTESRGEGPNGGRAAIVEAGRSVFLPPQDHGTVGFYNKEQRRLGFWREIAVSVQVKTLVRRQPTNCSNLSCVCNAADCTRKAMRTPFTRSGVFPWRTWNPSGQPSHGGYPLPLREYPRQQTIASPECPVHVLDDRGARPSANDRLPSSESSAEPQPERREKPATKYKIRALPSVEGETSKSTQ